MMIKLLTAKMVGAVIANIDDPRRNAQFVRHLFIRQRFILIREMLHTTFKEQLNEFIYRTTERFH